MGKSREYSFLRKKMDVKGPQHIKCSASFAVREMRTHFLKHWFSDIRLTRALTANLMVGILHQVQCTHKTTQLMEGLGWI